MKYRIAWDNHVTGQSGHGEWQNDYESVSIWIERANNEFPNIEHCIEEISPCMCPGGQTRSITSRTKEDSST